MFGYHVPGGSSSQNRAGAVGLAVKLPHGAKATTSSRVAIMGVAPEEHAASLIMGGLLALRLGRQWVEGKAKLLQICRLQSPSRHRLSDTALITGSISISDKCHHRFCCFATIGH